MRVTELSGRATRRSLANARGVAQPERTRGLADCARGDFDVASEAARAPDSAGGALPRRNCSRGLGIARPLDHRFMLVAAQQLTADGSRVVIKDSGGSLLREAEGGDERNGGLQPRVLMRFVRREMATSRWCTRWWRPARTSTRR